MNPINKKGENNMTNKQRDYQYIIVADYPETGECMVCPLANGISRYRANKILKQMIENPTENDKDLIEEGKNLRLKKIDTRDCWWNDPVMVR